jgi:tetratricopeptide (TPR) repeat protein
MTELFRGLIQVKDPLTLFAFVTLVMLVAFRTKGVPNLFLKLVLGRLSPEQISLLLKRSMRYAFLAFVLVCGIAASGQLLAYVGRSRPFSVEDARNQMEKNGIAAAQQQPAADAYSKGLALLDKGEFDRAIESLRNSLDAVPTLAAKYTLALAYQQKKDPDNAAKFAADALATAKSEGDPLAVLRAEQLVKSAASPAPDPVPPQPESTNSGKPGAIGPASPFPSGGKSIEEANPIKVGRYIWKEHLNELVFRYYKINLKAGQTLSIDFKTSDALAPSGYWLSGGATIYDHDGEVQAADNLLNARSALKSMQWTAPTSGWIYLSVGNSAGSQWPNDAGIVYVIWVQ